MRRKRSDCAPRLIELWYEECSLAELTVGVWQSIRWDPWSVDEVVETSLQLIQQF